MALRIVGLTATPQWNGVATDSASESSTGVAPPPLPRLLPLADVKVKMHPSPTSGSAVMGGEASI